MTDKSIARGESEVSEGVDLIRDFGNAAYELGELDQRDPGLHNKKVIKHRMAELALRSYILSLEATIHEQACDIMDV